VRPRRPDYRGEELDPERGPGLGCFWFQVIVLGFFIVIIPIGLNLGWPFEVLAILLFVVIGLLLLTGQTVIFLLRLVAADRRSAGRRRPLASPTKTVGELEDEQQGGQPSRPARATARPEGPVERVATTADAAPATAARPEPVAADAAPAGPESTADQVLPLDSESVIRAQRVGSRAAASPREPAADDDAAVPGVAGAAASVAAEALGERPFEEGMSAGSPPVSPQDSLTAGQQATLDAAPADVAGTAAQPADLPAAKAAGPPAAEPEAAPAGPADVPAVAEPAPNPADVPAASPADAIASPAEPEEPDPGMRQ
jgi:hypothetical protein